MDLQSWNLKYYLWRMFLGWVFFNAWIISYVTYNVIKSRKIFLTQTKEIREKYAPFYRYDVKHWSLLQCWLLLPNLFIYRALMAWSMIQIMGILGFFFGSFVEMNKPCPLFIRKIINTSFNQFDRYGFKMFGFEIRKHKCKISDYLDEYPEDDGNDNIRAPIIITNHTSGPLDVMYSLASDPVPSQVARIKIATYFVFGTMCKILQTFFIHQRGKGSGAVAQIAERVKKIQEKPDQYPPLNLFPEGTVSNGHYLIRFKKGAFIPMAPIKIIALDYHGGRFNFSNIGLRRVFSRCILVLQLHGYMDIYEFDTFDPKKIGLTDPKDWQKYADKAKEVFCKVLNRGSSNLSFQDQVEYEALSGFNWDW